MFASMIAAAALSTALVSGAAPLAMAATSAPLPPQSMACERASRVAHAHGLADKCKITYQVSAWSDAPSGTRHTVILQTTGPGDVFDLSTLVLTISAWNGGESSAVIDSTEIVANTDGRDQLLVTFTTSGPADADAFVTVTVVDHFTK